MSKIILVLDVVEGVDQEDVKLYMNEKYLFGLEDNKKFINGWTYHLEEDVHQVRGIALVEL